MGSLLACTRKDLVRRLRDPLALAIWVAVPLLLGLLLSSLGGGPGGTPVARVYWVDHDGSFASELLTRAAAGAPVVELIEVDEAAGRARLEEGEGSALVVLPQGFGEALLRGTPAELLLVRNPAQRILPGIVEEGLEVLVEAGFYLHELLGPELAVMLDGPPPGRDFLAEAEVAALSVRIQRRIEAVAESLFPPLLSVEPHREDEEQDPGPPGGLGAVFLPGMLFMSLLFVAQGMSQDLWSERDAGTLARARTTAAGMLPVVLGKVLSAGALVALVAAVTLGVGALAWDFDLALLPLALGWCLLAGLVLSCFFLAVQTLAGSARGGSVLTSVVVFPMMMIGGSFFPYEAMPDWMAAVGAWTPNGQGVVRLAELLRGELAPGALLRSGGALALFGAASGLVAVLRLGRRP